MYGVSAGHLLVVLYLLSAGVLIESGLPTLKMLDNLTRGCTDYGLIINIRCRTKSKRLTGNNRLLPSDTANRTNPNRCCLLSRLSTSNDADTANHSCLGPTQESDRFRRMAKDSVDSSWLPPCTMLELRICQGDEAHFLCEFNATHRRGRSKVLVSWKTPSGDVIVRGPSLVVPAVRRQDGGLYICEVADAVGTVLTKRKLRLIVQFPPVIKVPNHYNPSLIAEDQEIVGRLLCTAEAVPTATLTWYKDSVLIDNSTYRSTYSTTSETTDCTTNSFLLFRKNNASSSKSFLNFSTDQSELFYGNYTCTATNDYGYTSKLFSFYGFTEEEEEEEEIRKFNVTGFIIGMLPPIFISFYIILKLGYRSRYAEERPEEDGLREEPFFISY